MNGRASKHVLTLVAITATLLASPAAATSAPKTRVIDCEAGSCLQVTGHRAHEGAAVSINGHAVPVEGSRKWRLALPVETVREWSKPYARTITVSVASAGKGTAATSEVDLPIGLLGKSATLTMLVVRAK